MTAEMDFNDLLKSKGIDPQHVLVLRHRPSEPELNKVLPWLAAEKPDVFNAYQQTQVARLEKAMERMVGSGYVASFIGHEPGKALFIGLYSIGKTKPLTLKQYWQVPEYKMMKEAFGLRGFTGDKGRKNVLWFNLSLTDQFASWKGKLVVGWPPGMLWWRRAHRNEIPVLSILEESRLDAVMPEWDAINLSWEELKVLPSRWKAALKQWRGIYYIFDTSDGNTSDGKGYVGAAYGKDNIYGRWLNYAARGHGGNKLLKQRDPRHFRFSILQRVSPDMSATDLLRIESSWKERLHTRKPFGLNDN